MKEIRRLFILPMLIGILGGFSALGVREIIHYTSIVDSADILENDNYLFLFFIPIVFLISSYIINNFLKDTTNPTIDSVAKSIILKKGNLDYKKGIASVLLTSANIGFGIPVGREGPIAKFGGSATAFFLKYFNIKGINKPLFVTCGVISALAATFNAPIAAIVFGFEIVLGRLNFNIFIPLSISSITATIISRYFLGNYPTFYVHKLSYENLFLIVIPIVAILFALAIIFFETLFKNINSFYLKKGFKYYHKALIGGSIVAVLLFFFPDAASLGYAEVNRMFEVTYSYSNTFWLSIVKIIVIAFTFASGMFGGIFAPSIFIGGFLGYSIGGLLSYFMNIDPLVVALIGTASVTAGMSNAPFRASLIIIELTQNYQMAVPIILSSVLTSYFVQLAEDKIYYLRAIMQKGFDLSNLEYRAKLKQLEFTHLIDDSVKILEPNEYIKDIIYDLMDGNSSYFPVLENKKLIGILSFRDIRSIKDSKDYNSIQVKDIMTKNPHFLTKESNGLDVFEMISSADLSYIPIVENENSKIYIGMLNILAFKKFVSVLYLHKED